MINYLHLLKYLILGILVSLIFTISYLHRVPRLTIDKIIFIGLSASLLYAILDKLRCEKFTSQKDASGVPRRYWSDIAPSNNYDSNTLYETTGYNEIETDISTRAKLDMLYNQEHRFYNKLMDGINRENNYISEKSVMNPNAINKDINIIEPETWGKSPNLEFQESRRIIPSQRQIIIDDDEKAIMQKRLDDYDNMREYSDMDEPKINTINYGYKLMFGDYAWGVLYSGYNEYIQESNNEKLTETLSRYPDAVTISELYNKKPNTQSGGAISKKTFSDRNEYYSDFNEEFTQQTTNASHTTGASHATNASHTTGASHATNAPHTTGASHATNAPHSTNAPHTTNDQNLTTSIINYALELDSASRSPGDLCSSDLIMLFSTNKTKVMQRGTVDSQIVFEPPLKYIGTNLSKVRFELKTNSSTDNNDFMKNIPISYGNVIYIKHNIYYNNKNTQRFIKYGKNLQSHQDGDLYNEFVILNPVNINDKSKVDINKPFILSINDTTSGNTFLKIEINGTVSSASPIEAATSFYAVIYRPTELYKKHLHVAMDDIIFP